MARPLRNAQFRMDHDMDTFTGRNNQPEATARRTISRNRSSSSGTSNQSSSMGLTRSDESDSLFLLNAYSLNEDQTNQLQQHPPTSTSGSSSTTTISYSQHNVITFAGKEDAFSTLALGLSAYQKATETAKREGRTDQEALVSYGTALEYFEAALRHLEAENQQNRNNQLQISNSRTIAIIHQALCIAAMGQLLRPTNITTALAMWDQALECLEQGLTDLQRRSQRYDPPSAINNNPPVSVGCLEAVFVELVRSKTLTLLSLLPTVSQDTSPLQRQKLQQQYEELVDCNTQALRFLLDIRHFEQIRCLINTKDAPADTFTYKCLSLEQHSLLLMETVKQLIQHNAQQRRMKPMKVNDTYLRPEEEPVWIQRAEQALHVLQTRQYELTKPQRRVVAMIQEEMSHVYLQFYDLERGSQAMVDACDLLLGDQQSPPSEWLDRMEYFGHLLEREATSDATHNLDVIDVDAAGTLELAMACYEKALLLRNQSGLLLKAERDTTASAHHDLAVANALSLVARVMQLQGNYEGSTDIFRAAHAIYARQRNYAVLATVAEDALLHGRWDQAVAVLSQCVELAECESATQGTSRENESTQLDKSFIYFTLAKAYVGRCDYVSATMCLMEADKHDGRIAKSSIHALLHQVEFLRREDYKGELEDGSFDDFNNRDPYSDQRSVTNSGSYAAESYGDDDEGTAFYDSESISAFNPTIGKGLAPSTLKDFCTGVHVILDLPEDLSPSKGLQQTPDRSYGSDRVSEKKSMDDEHPPLPVISPDASYQEENNKPPSSPMSAIYAQRLKMNASLDKGSSHSAPNLMRRFKSPLRGRKDQSSVGESSQRSGLAKAIANTFKFANRNDNLKIPPSGRDASKSRDGRSNTRGMASHPLEDEFHAAVDITEIPSGPLDTIEIPQTMSFDSDISSITMRLDVPNTPKGSGQDFWWGVTAEGLGRWLPTVVTTAVEVAEGFLSARSIHSQKKRTPLFDYATSEDSDDDNTEAEDVVSRPAIADSRTQLAVRGSRASTSRVKRAPTTRSYYDSGALSIYSGTRPKVKELDFEIERYNELIADQVKAFGKNHLKLAESFFTLAILHSQLGASGSTSAIECASEALRIQRACGVMDRASRSLHLLADLYTHEKNYSTSLALLTEALRLERIQYGQLSDEASKTLNRIGTVHAIQNEFLHAMECHQEALRILQATHGEDIKHHLISETLCQIGSVYYRERNAYTRSTLNTDRYTTFIEAGMLETIGRAHENRGSYKMAISFFEERLAFLENRVVPSAYNAEEVAETLNSLGMLSAKAGRLAEALEYYEKSLRLQVKVGCDAAQLATIRVLMGSVHFQLGNWHGALSLQQDALAILTEELGDEHETIAAAYYQVGLVQAECYHLNEAMTSLTTALEIQKKLLGADHAATLRSRREIGNQYAIKSSDCDTALEMFDEILNAQRAIHGDRHPNIAETLFSIGRAYARRGDYSSALQILEETYHMRTESLGHDVPAQATTLYEISVIHLKRKHIKRALQICDVVLTIREDALRDKHIDIALTLMVKGCCFIAQNRLDDAENLLIVALETGTESAGQWHPSVAEIHLAVSLLHLKQCHFDLARVSVDRALKIYKRVGLDNNDYPCYKEAKLQLERIEHDECLFV
ncbi:hypothetical protein MPSEU_000153800 [Mayamaea pseudoterrestris]|nr:hypothetical protein MPSEU_000153800 [Mayamaea pseudoterrestris]